MSPMENRKVQLLITQGKSFDLRLRVGLGESGRLALMSQQWPEERRCGFVEDKRRTRKGNWCCLNKPDL